MKLLPLDKLGAREIASKVLDFGIYLPGVSADDGTKLWVKIIHEQDQFRQGIDPLLFEMNHSKDSDYEDYWHAQMDIDQVEPDVPTGQRSSWGMPGKYVYRYYLERPKAGKQIDWIIDPFAREFGIGKLSSITVGYEERPWNEEEKSWKIPKLEDIIIYELMIGEFGESIDGTINRLGYLRDLGINCIEVMPVNHVATLVDWGYMPLGYFGIDDRFGNQKDMQKLIDSAHQLGIAVVLDMVYGHTSEDFSYAYVYRELGIPSPFIGPFTEDRFGESTDFNKALTRDFFFTANYYWLDKYHADGFRYDSVPEYWDGPMGNGYANLVYETFQMVKAKQNEAGYWQRFFDGGSINLIQCAEDLDAPTTVLNDSYTNCTWQDGTLGSAEQTAGSDGSNLEGFGLNLGLTGYPEIKAVNDDTIKKTALQYIENHDHARFICNFGLLDTGIELLKEGDRSRWYKVQPYLIGIFAAKGMPMLWQGQEFCENYWVPPYGAALSNARPKLFRPMRWDYFYTTEGKQTVNLVRRLIRLRRSRPQLRYGEHFYYNVGPLGDLCRSKKLMIFHRKYGNNFSLIALNFGDQDQTVPFIFPLAGNYLEELDGNENNSLNLKDVASESKIDITVPSNYGRIWTVHVR